MKWKQAQDLNVGDEIVINNDRVDTVIARTELDQYGGCVIHTRNATTLACLPRYVQVVN